jgi:hypothetical protein
MNNNSQLATRNIAIESTLHQSEALKQACLRRPTPESSSSPDPKAPSSPTRSRPTGPSVYRPRRISRMERSSSGSCGSVWSVDQVYSLLVCRLTGELTLVGLELQDASMTTWLKEFRSKPFHQPSLLFWPPGTTENLQTSERKAEITLFLPLTAEPHRRLPAPSQTRCGHAS